MANSFPLNELAIVKVMQVHVLGSEVRGATSHVTPKEKTATGKHALKIFNCNIKGEVGRSDSFAYTVVPGFILRLTVKVIPDKS